MIDIEAPLSVDMRSDGLRHLAVLRRKQCVGLQPSLVKADVVERQIENVGQHGVTRYVTTHRIANDETAHRRHHKRSEEHTSELQSLMRNSYAVFCLKKK